jgi:hypothetical protein
LAGYKVFSAPFSFFLVCTRVTYGIHERKRSPGNPAKNKERAAANPGHACGALRLSLFAKQNGAVSAVFGRLTDDEV